MISLFSLGINKNSPFKKGLNGTLDLDYESKSLLIINIFDVTR